MLASSYGRSQSVSKWSDPADAANAARKAAPFPTLRPVWITWQSGRESSSPDSTPRVLPSSTTTSVQAQPGDWARSADSRCAACAPHPACGLKHGSTNVIVAVEVLSSERCETSAGSEGSSVGKGGAGSAGSKFGRLVVGGTGRSNKRPVTRARQSAVAVPDSRSAYLPLPAAVCRPRPPTRNFLGWLHPQPGPSREHRRPKAGFHQRHGRRGQGDR